MVRELLVRPQLELIRRDPAADTLVGGVRKSTTGEPGGEPAHTGSEAMTTATAEHSLPTATASPQPRNLAVWLLAGIMACSGGIALSFVATLGAPADAPFEMSVWLLMPLFAIAEIAIIHIPVRRDAHTISLAEIPLISAFPAQARKAW